MSTFGTSKTKLKGVEIHSEDGVRFTLTFDGLARYTGSLEECQKRAVILTKPFDRGDKALYRACGRV